MGKLIAGFGRVLLEEVIEHDQKTSGGLFIPETTKANFNLGKVISVGDPIKSDFEGKPLIVTEGSLVVYQKYAGNNFEFEGKKLVSIEITDIIAIKQD